MLENLNQEHKVLRASHSLLQFRHKLLKVFWSVYVLVVFHYCQYEFQLVFVFLRAEFWVGEEFNVFPHQFLVGLVFERKGLQQMMGSFEDLSDFEDKGVLCIWVAGVSNFEHQVFVFFNESDQIVIDFEVSEHLLHKLIHFSLSSYLSELQFV